MMVVVGGCTSALTDAQYLSYVVLKSLAIELHETIEYGFDEILFHKWINGRPE